MNWPLIREHVLMGMAGAVIGALLAMQTSSTPVPDTAPPTVITGTTAG